VLETIAQTLGPVPRVLLRDTGPGEPAGPVVRPDAAPADDSIRYRIDGEIARGGMGAVLKGRDPDLGRDVAIKVLRDDYRGRPEMVRRFVEEAQIGGQLQHPGVVPIYELGTFADRRPFFSMKLVKGQTLAALLAGRSSPAADLPRLLAIFEAVCQTMAYAHTRGVIHRDLKPSNVMVGAFGEVQVMDWGLAKVLPRGGLADDATAGQVREETVIATARSGSNADQSHVGSIMGTPAYMAPEQARGEVDRLDERCDVFALGSILCEALTGRPAFTGRDAGEVQRKAALGDTADALARLASCGADADLIDLSKDCLAREREDRLRDASAVADRVTAHIAGVRERMRRAELATVEERARRRLTTVVAASLLALTTAGGLGAAYYLQQRQAVAARVALALKEATLLRDQAEAHPDDPARWPAALEGLKRAEMTLADGGDAEARRALADLRDRVQAGADAADRDRILLDALVEVRAAKGDDDRLATEAAYADAFREAGMDVIALTPDEAGARIKARPRSVALAIATALDDWATLRRVELRDATGASRLTEAARIADPDPWRNDLRRALDRADTSERLAALKALAGSARFDELHPATLVLLGNGLAGAGDREAAEAVLSEAQRRHPGDLWTNQDLGRVLKDRSKREEAIRYFLAARALHPPIGHELAHALEAKGERDEALAVLRDLVRMQPARGFHLACLGRHLLERGRSGEAAEALEAAVADFQERVRHHPEYPWAHAKLGDALSNQGHVDEAIAAYREAVRLRPDEPSFLNGLGLALDARGKLDDAITCYREVIRLRPEFHHAHYNLGNAFRKLGNLEEAVAAYREAIRLQPDHTEVYSNLGLAYKDQGKLDEAIAAFREAIRLRPDDGQVYSNLGIVLEAQGKRDEAVAAFREAIRFRPEFALAHSNLGAALFTRGQVEEAFAAYREAIRLKPDLPEPHFNLGIDLKRLGRLDEAIDELRQAARLKPDHAEAHYNLGVVLSASGDLPGAIAACREAIRLRPDYPEARYNLGNTLRTSGDLPGAIAAYREAVRSRPDFAEAHCNLGLVLRQEGDYAGAVSALRRGHELGSKRPNWRYPSAQWLAEAERMAAVAERLDAVLKGDDQPRNDAERLAFGQMCFDTKRYAAAARLWGEALDSDPKLGEDRQAPHRYNAACAAALAADGKDRDGPLPMEGSKALRARALGWLRAELDAWAKVIESNGPQAKATAARTLQHWQQDADLASVRDPEALAKLPEAEHGEWKALWAEVEALLLKAR
jgi:serine/threonine-protein kinase